MKKKILSILITVLSLCMCMFTLTACGENEPPHTHTYSVLKYDTENHWYECSCGEKKDIENHEGGTATETNKATCSVCNQEYGESLGHVHTLHLTKVDAKPQSCTQEGNREYYTCSCGKWFTDNTATTEITDKSSVVIEKDAHKYETLKKTVTEHWWECSCGDKDGLEEHHGGNATCTQKAVCDDCGIEYGSKKSHSYTILKQSATQHWWECSCGAYETKENHNPGAEATETTDQKCTECQYVIAPALGHVHTLHLTKVDAKPQSCTQEGNREYYTCSCGKWFTNNSATTEITDKTSVVIAKDDHKYETLKKTATEHWYECSCGDKDGLEEHHGGNATCTQKAVCDDCGVEYGSLEKHNYTELKKSTTQHWWECACGAYETKENHKGGTATCKQKAICSVCDAVYGDFAEHSPKIDWIITDTHHYHECSYGCNEKLNYSEHSFTNYVSNKDATYESDGTKTAQCDGGCGKTHTVTDIGSMLIKNEIRFTTLTVDGKNVYGKVSNATTEFVFYEEIVVSGNATYVVDDDKSCSSPIASKTVDLVVGDNTFYVLETVGNNVKLYTVTIHRREMFTVTFNTDGGTAVDCQIVEEDSFATAPITSKTGYTFDKWDYDFNTAITKDTVINAKWSINQYTITIVYNNGQDDLVLMQDYNSNIETISNPTKTGYSFAGWDKTIPSKMPAEDLTITATWKINQYTITIVYNNGQANLVIKQDYNTDIEAIENPEKTGYTFAGWDKTIPSKMPAENIKITASWDAIEYDIVYNPNGGSLSTSKNKYTIEQSITFDNPTRDYYTFSGWYDNADFSGDAVTGIVVGTYGNIELYAKWTPINYGITYVLNGGTNDKDNTSQYNVETETIIFNEPTRDGYSFDGWYLEETFDTKVNLIENGSHTNVKIYAKWIAIFTLSGGEITGLTDHGITLAKLIVPEKIDGVEISSISKGAFNSCLKLECITIPFVGATLEKNDYDNHFGYIFGASSYHYNDDYVPSSLKTVIINGGTSIDGYAFFGCTSLTSVEIGDSVTRIGYDAFFCCTSLTSVEIGDSVTSIGSDAFYNCSSLTNITISNSVTSIGGYAFYDCDSLTKINYLGTIDEWVMISFNGSESNPIRYSDNLYINNVLVVEANLTTAIYISDYAFFGYDPLSNVTICDSVTNIGDYAFGHCQLLTRVEISNSIKSIGEYAFYGCSSLEYNIKDSLKYLGNNNNPYLCLIDAVGTKITTAKIESNCKIIGPYVFDDCDSLTSVVIPNSVTSIGESAFSDCSKLKTVCHVGTAEDWTEIIIGSYNTPLTNAERYYNYDGQNHTYQFIVNGGQSVSDITTNLAISLPTPIKESWYFDGWYDNMEFTGTPYIKTYYSSTNTILYARWVTESEYYDGSSIERAKNVAIGERVNYTEGETIYYAFKPIESKTYTIKVNTPLTGSVSMVCNLYDSDYYRKRSVSTTDRYCTTSSLTAGETYYVAIKFTIDNNDETATFTVSIT